MTTASVAANVRYINTDWRDRDGAPRIGSRDTRRANTSFQQVQVHDVRAEITDGSIGLDDAGFTVVSHRSAMAAGSFTDKAAVQEVYYPEMLALVRRVTGADQAFMSGHQVRTEVPPSFNEGYARFVHCDYHLGDRDKMAKEILAKQGIEPQPHWQYAWYNTWQPFDNPVQRNPLACIDVRSMPDEDIIDYYYTGGGSDNLVAAPVYNPSHKWCYVPQMETTEVLLLKQLDSRPGRAVCSPHSSFDDQTSPADALPRRSIETRLMCVFENAD